MTGVPEPHDRENYEEFTINLGPQWAKHFRDMSSMAKLNAELDEEARTTPVFMHDLHGFRAHLQTAHGMDPALTEFRDEYAHEEVPGLPPVDWDTITEVPRLSHADLWAIHRHDHHGGGYESNYPYEQNGDEHRHL